MLIWLWLFTALNQPLIDSELIANQKRVKALQQQQVVLEKQKAEQLQRYRFWLQHSVMSSSDTPWPAFFTEHHLLQLLSTEKQIETLTQQKKLFVERQQTLVALKPAPIKKPSIVVAFAQNKGKLGWPVSGKILSALGKHQGVVIKTPNNTIKAVADGKVAYAEKLKGFGKLVIVDHGHDYHSVVGNLNTLLVKKGARIQKGQTLGALAKNQHEVYFELRHKSIPLDAKAWLKKP